MKRELIERAAFFVFLMTLCACAMPVSDQHVQNSPVQPSHITEINSLFQENGLKEAIATFDKYGRVILKGSYADNKEVDKAFSLSQTVVGPKWVSPVTPENIKVKDWERKISSFFPTKKNSQSTAAKPTVPPAVTDVLTGESEVPPGPIAAKYAVVVGISEFQEKSINLRYAQKDAEAVCNYLLDPLGGNFKKENVSLILNENATRDNIAKALDDIRQKAKEDDLVVLFFSSHGTPPARTGGIYIVTYDTIMTPRYSVWESSFSSNILKDFIHQLKAKRLVVIMDVCHSNGAFSQIKGFQPMGGKSLGILDADQESYGASLLFKDENIRGAKDIVLDDEPVQPAKTPSSVSGWGKALFSSSDAQEKSWESDRLRNSFFTHYFIEGLKKFGNVKDAFYYAKPMITEEVWKEKYAKQHPQVAADRNEWSISLK